LLLIDKQNVMYELIWTFRPFNSRHVPPSTKVPTAAGTASDGKPLAANFNFANDDADLRTKDVDMQALRKLLPRSTVRLISKPPTFSDPASRQQPSQLEAPSSIRYWLYF
jgi:hypothetical protein